MGFPINPPNVPIVSPDGRTVSNDWYRFFRDIQKMLGGAGDPFTNSALLGSLPVQFAVGMNGNAGDMLAPPARVPMETSDLLAPYFAAGASGLLARFTATTDGLAPLSGGGVANYLRADGTWAPPAGPGIGYTVATTAIDYAETATTGEKIVTVTVTGKTVTLPTAVGNVAKLTFKLMVAGTFTIDGAGAETIDDGLTAVLLSQYAAVTIISDNAQWLVI